MNLDSKQNLLATIFKHKKDKTIFQLLKKLAGNRYGIITVPIVYSLIIGVRLASWLATTFRMVSTGYFLPNAPT